MGSKSVTATLNTSDAWPPDDSKKRVSGSPSDAYCYSPLPGPDTIRLLCLMPHRDRRAPIRCRIVEYPLRGPGQKTNIYEALSYVWGSEQNKQPIYVQSNDQSGSSSTTSPVRDDCRLPVTANLYEALTYLRDGVLERIIWIDAVCINQQDNHEKGHQVQSMAEIYASASRVIIWLGRAADGSDKALEALHRAAVGHSAPPTLDQSTKKAILALFERPWFQRIWVLQEAAAARYVMIKCGVSAVDGTAFCSGFAASQLSYDLRPGLQHLISPVTHLIRSAASRPLYETGLLETRPSGSFSLNIRPLAELVDMFHTRKAANPLDKVYALLGMTSDDPRAAGLLSDYTKPWAEVFRKLVQFCLSDQMSVDTWNEPQDLRTAAVVRGKGHILGKVSSVDFLGDSQSIGIDWKNSGGGFDVHDEASSPYLLQPSANPIIPGDVVCLLQGASKPSIVRPRDCYSEIIIIAAPLAESNANLRNWLPPTTASAINFVLVWQWDAAQHDRDYDLLISKQDYLDKTTRLWNFGLLLNAMERYEPARENLQKAVEVYTTGLRSTGGQPDHKSWLEADEETRRPLHDLTTRTADDATSFNDQTPLCWAANNAHYAVVKLLLDKGANFEARDDSGCTLLSRAAEQGQDAAVKLLLDRGADFENRDKFGLTPLSRAAKNGHDAVLRRLFHKGASVNTKDNRDYTPLHFAAAYGHEAVARLLATELGSDRRARNKVQDTPLDLAAQYGEGPMVKLFATELGVNTELWKESEAPEALYHAVKHGQEAVVNLLITQLGANKEAAGRWKEKKPLLEAVQYGHEAIARLLVTKLAADTKATDDQGSAALHYAAWYGHDTIVKMLLTESGADLEAKNKHGLTPLHVAAQHGRTAVARLLVTEYGADKEARDNRGWTPLHYAAVHSSGEDIVKLLVKLGVDKEAKDFKGQTPVWAAAEAAQVEIAELLVELGADQSVREGGTRQLEAAQYADYKRWEMNQGFDHGTHGIR